MHQPQQGYLPESLIRLRGLRTKAAMGVFNPSKGKVIVFGILFWFPLAGVTYQFIHFLLGLRRLGYDVYYIEDSGRWIYDPDLNDLSPNASKNIKAVAPILEAYGFKDRWGFRGDYPGGQCYGLDEARILQLYGEVEACLNVTGSQELREEHRACARHIYVETDPVAGQILVAQGDQDMIDTLTSHDTHFTYGGNFGQPDCRVPLERFNWLPTVQPVLLDLWDNQILPGADAYFNTIATWQNQGKDIVFNGETYYWSKDREFRKFIDLPDDGGHNFELAVGVEGTDRQLLEAHRWKLTDPVDLSRNMASYHDFIVNSRGEFTVAKDQNIRLRSGWFSDRSACYLAAGRPVITQDTAFGSYLPTGKGLFSFQTREDILAALEEISTDYRGNCEAAREIAAEYFAAEKVLASLMSRAGL